MCFLIDIVNPFGSIIMNGGGHPQFVHEQLVMAHHRRFSQQLDLTQRTAWWISCELPFMVETQQVGRFLKWWWLPQN